MSKIIDLFSNWKLIDIGKESSSIPSPGSQHRCMKEDAK